MKFKRLKQTNHPVKAGWYKMKAEVKLEHVCEEEHVTSGEPCPFAHSKIIGDEFGAILNKYKNKRKSIDSECPCIVVFFDANHFILDKLAKNSFLIYKPIKQRDHPDKAGWYNMTAKVKLKHVCEIEHVTSVEECPFTKEGIIGREFKAILKKWTNQSITKDLRSQRNSGD